MRYFAIGMLALTLLLMTGCLTEILPREEALVIEPTERPSFPITLPLRFQEAEEKLSLNVDKIKRPVSLLHDPSKSETFWTLDPTKRKLTLHQFSLQRPDPIVWWHEEIELFSPAAIAWFDKDVLMIADTEDEDFLRQKISIYVVKPNTELVGQLQLLQKIDFVYPDVSKDCHAVIIEPVTRNVLFLANDKLGDSFVYRASLPDVTDAAIDEKVHELKLIGKIPLKATTDIAVSHDARQMIVLSIFGTAHYQRHPGQTWMAALSKKPQRLSLPDDVTFTGISIDERREVIWLISDDARKKKLWQMKYRQVGRE